MIQALFWRSVVNALRLEVGTAVGAAHTPKSGRSHRCRCGQFAFSPKGRPTRGRQGRSAALPCKSHDRGARRAFDEEQRYSRGHGQFLLLVSLLAGAGSLRRSGAQPQGGRVRGASARRALETDRGDGTSPANWFSPALAGADFWGSMARSACHPPLGDWMCAKRWSLTSRPVGAAQAAISWPVGPQFLFFLLGQYKPMLSGYPQSFLG